jgi:hypothetical protein
LWLLGSKCATCGFDGDGRILQVLYNQDAREEYAKHNRISFYLHVLEDLEKNKDNYHLICPNCKFTLMHNKRDEQLHVERESLPQKITVVWQTGLSLHDAFTSKFAWIDKYLEDGAEILVIPIDEKVYKYKQKTSLADSWNAYLLSHPDSDYPPLGNSPVMIIKESV